MLQLISKYQTRIYEPQDLEDVVTLLTDSYKKMNPILNQNWICQETLRTEFRAQITNKVYTNGFVIVDIQSQQIIACGFISPLKQFQIDMKTDLSKVPTRKDIMKYLRDVMIMKCMEAIDLDTDKSCVGSLLAVKQQYAGQGICVWMFYQLSLLSRQNGFQNLMGNVTNEKIKYVIRKYLSYETYGIIHLNDLTILEGNEKPFKGLDVTQEGGFMNVDESIRRVEEMIKMQEPQPINLQMSRL